MRSSAQDTLFPLSSNDAGITAPTYDQAKKALLIALRAGYSTTKLSQVVRHLKNLNFSALELEHVADTEVLPTEPEMIRLTPLE